MRPRVSIVMPHKNRSHLVANAINSLRNQTMQDWELVIVDDGSTKEEVERLQGVLRKFNDERIRTFFFPEIGMVAARNTGNKLATADILTMQDSDDLSLPDRLEKALSAFRWCDVLYHGLYKNMWDAQFNCMLREYIPAQKLDKKKLLKSQYIPSAPFYTKSVWKKRPFRMETQFAFDWMMYLDWAFSGFRFKNLDIGLYEYVRQKDSASLAYEMDGRRGKSMKKIQEIMQKEYHATVNSGGNDVI